MNKHTPGPWGLGDGEMHVYYLNPEVEAGDETIDDPRHDSIVAQCGDMGPFSGISDEECRANARLISAAPDLFAACEQLTEALAPMGGTASPEVEQGFLAARDAIRKARGF